MKKTLYQSLTLKEELHSLENECTIWASESKIQACESNKIISVFNVDDSISVSWSFLSTRYTIVHL